jgi:hypothetical protein
VEAEPLIYCEEVTAILQVLADINVTTRQIRELLEEGSDGEEASDEDNS